MSIRTSVCLSLLSWQQALVESFAGSRQCSLDHLLAGLVSSRCLVLFILWSSLPMSFLSTVMFPGCLSGSYCCPGMKGKQSSSVGARLRGQWAEGKTGIAEVPQENRKAVGNREERSLRQWGSALVSSLSFWECNSVVDNLPRKHEVLGSNPNPSLSPPHKLTRL